MRNPKAIIANLYHVLLIYVTSILIYGCGNSDRNPTIDKLYDDSQSTFIESLSETEDLIFDIYLNSDLKVSLYRNELIDIKNNSLSINKLSYQQKLYAYVTPFCCANCIMELDSLFRAKNINHSYIGPYNSRDDLILMFKILHIPIEKIIFINEALNIPLENQNRIFTFTLNKSYELCDIFTPKRHLKNLTDAYLDAVQNKYTTHNPNQIKN